MSNDFHYTSTEQFITAVQTAAAPDTGGALFDTTVLIRRLGVAHPDWIEEALIAMLLSSNALIRLALADALEYIEPTDHDLAARLSQRLAADETSAVRRRMEVLTAAH
jgi:hypothetical protein